MYAIRSGWCTASIPATSRALKATSPSFMSASRRAVRPVSWAVSGMSDSLRCSFVEVTTILVFTLTILGWMYSGGASLPRKARVAGMSGTGLRELKKARARRHIADTAARLFADRGYEHVSVTDVDREAQVAEQTVYNYFPTQV